jgi:hypothetical protein
LSDIWAERPVPSDGFVQYVRADLDAPQQAAPQPTPPADAREAMRLALDALNDYEKHTGWGSSAADALRAALEGK